MGEPYLHDAVLNRLETYLEYGEEQVFFSRESFTNLDAWTGIPVIYAEVVNGAIRHPDFSLVTNRTLPDGFRFAGVINYAYIPDDGNPRLSAMMCITDPEVDAIAQAGQLGISTGFTASKIPYELGSRLIGDVTPNHVLVFTQGACPNCYGRDNAAMFLNIQEAPMAETAEEKTILQKIADKLYNLAYQVEEAPQTDAVVEEVENTAEPEPVIEQTEEVTVENTEDAPAVEEVAEEVTEEPAELSNVVAEENEQLKNTIAEMEQRIRDIEWTNAKATVPKGWLGEKEAEYREKFENNRDAFYQELMAHEHTFPNTKAEGEKICPCKLEAELKNIVSENAKKIGYTPME